MSNMTITPDPTLASLAGQVALITGGGRGIGRMTALALSRAGVKVAVAARSRDELDETVRLVEAQGGQAIAFALDVAEQGAVEQMVGETIRQLGPIDLLINNAAMTGAADQGWELADDWWRVIEVNLRGPYLCAQAVLPGMVARQRGRIINVSSNAGVRPTPPYSAYSVSKAALIRLTDSLAEMTRDQGICVFGISPGMVKTAMTKAMPIMDNKPEADWVPPERAAELCVFLASGQADRLSGRYVHVLDDIRDLVRRAEEIEASDTYALRVRKL